MSRTRSVVLAHFNADRALSHGRQKFICAHDMDGVLGQTETFQSRKCKKRRIDFTGVELAQPRFHIAA